MRRVEAPQFWSVAGPNGSGKSTLYDSTDIGRERSFGQLPWFLDHADQAFIFDNSGAEPQLVGKKEAGELVLDHDAPEDIRKAISQLGE